MAATLFALALSKPAPASAAVSDQELERISQALPTRAPAAPLQPRRLLIFDSNVGYGGHPSAAHANAAFRLMGERTGAFTTEVSRDPGVFAVERLKSFDAVFFNNTVGNLFEDPVLRRNLVEFVYRGGGLMGVHGTSVAFTRWPGAIEDWPEFGRMLGARGASHRESTERVVIRIEDPGHPVTQVFPPNGFEYRDEFFRFSDPYSRLRVRVLMSIDTNRTDLNQGAARGTCLRPDHDYALAWVRHYGRGRVFYCTIAHNPYVFWDTNMLRFYLAAAQFALGDLPAPTLPSAWLTPANLACERLGWRPSLFEPPAEGMSAPRSIDQAAAQQLPYLVLPFGCLVSRQSKAALGQRLPPEDMEHFRLSLDGAGLRLLGCDAGRLPTDTNQLAEVLERARDLGVEVLLAEAPSELVANLQEAAQAAAIHIALRPAANAAMPEAWQPDRLLALCEGRGSRIGVHVDLGQWLKGDIRPAAAVARLGNRIKSLSVPRYLSQPESEVFKAFLATMLAEKVTPLFIGFHVSPSHEAPPAATDAIALLNTQAQKLHP